MWCCVGCAGDNLEVQWGAIEINTTRDVSLHIECYALARHVVYLFQLHITVVEDFEVIRSSPLVGDGPVLIFKFHLCTEA